MQRALVVLDDIFYCSVGNVQDRSLQIGQGFCPFFILYKYKTKITARLPECHIPNRRAVIYICLILSGAFVSLSRNLTARG